MADLNPHCRCDPPVEMCLMANRSFAQLRAGASALLCTLPVGHAGNHRHGEKGQTWLFGHRIAKRYRRGRPPCASCGLPILPPMTAKRLAAAAGKRERKAAKRLDHGDPMSKLVMDPQGYAGEDASTDPVVGGRRIVRPVADPPAWVGNVLPDPYSPPDESGK